MPDIVPIVRRPVRKLNSPPEIESGEKIEKSLGRKFNLPGDKNSVNKVKRFCDSKETTTTGSKNFFDLDRDLPTPIVACYDVSQFSTKSTLFNPRELKVAEQRVAKTNVSFQIYYPNLSVHFL